MKVLILSDVHANRAALGAVLAAEPDTEKVLCLGDLVAYGPNPIECVEWAMRKGPGSWLLQGNHDRAVAKSEDPRCSPTTARTFNPGSPAQRQIDRALSPRLKSRGCRVCDYLGEVVLDFFSRTQYSLYSDERSQSAFAAAGGLCALHLWQLHSVSSPLGEAAGLAPLVERISRLLAQVRNRSQAQATVNALLLDSDSCPVCARLQEDERDFIKRLAWSLDEPEGLAAYGRSQGVCLRHLAVLVGAVSRDDLIRSIIAGAAWHFQETAEDMHSYATLLAVGRRDLTNSDEIDAALRAITHLVGSRSLCMPSSGQGEL